MSTDWSITVLKRRKIKHTHKHFDKDVCKADKDPKVTCAGLKGRCFLELKSVLLEVSYIEKWPKFAYLESKVPHLKFRVMRDRVYMVG